MGEWGESLASMSRGQEHIFHREPSSFSSRFSHAYSLLSDHVQFSVHLYLFLSAHVLLFSWLMIGRAGASCMSGMIFQFRSFGLAYRNCLRASFYALSQFFPHGHCTAHALTRSDFGFTASTIDVDFHSTRRPVSSSANAHCQV